MVRSWTWLVTLAAELDEVAEVEGASASGAELSLLKVLEAGGIDVGSADCDEEVVPPAEEAAVWLLVPEDVVEVLLDVAVLDDEFSPTASPYSSGPSMRDAETKRLTFCV